MINMTLNSDEITALRYYIGDVGEHLYKSPAKLIGDTEIYMRKFFSEPKAYLIINSMFFPDTETEKARAKENKFLNPEIVRYPVLMRYVYKNLFSEFRKCTAKKDMKTFRIERFSDYLYIKKTGGTVSFTSTSKNGFLHNYRDRSGIALMEFELKSGTPCIDIQEILRGYRSPLQPYEPEVILPPFMELQITEIPLTQEMLQITDSENNPPLVCCKAIPKGRIYLNSESNDSPEKYIDSAVRFLECLNNKKPPSSEDEINYIRFKKAFLAETENMM